MNLTFHQLNTTFGSLFFHVGVSRNLWFLRPLWLSFGEQQRSQRGVWPYMQLIPPSSGVTLSQPHHNILEQKLNYQIIDSNTTFHKTVKNTKDNWYMLYFVRLREKKVCFHVFHIQVSKFKQISLCSNGSKLSIVVVYDGPHTLCTKLNMSSGQVTGSTFQLVLLVKGFICVAGVDTVQEISAQYKSVSPSENQTLVLKDTDTMYKGAMDNYRMTEHKFCLVEIVVSKGKTIALAVNLSFSGYFSTNCIYGGFSDFMRVMGKYKQIIALCHNTLVPKKLISTDISVLLVIYSYRALSSIKFQIRLKQSRCEGVFLNPDIMAAFRRLLYHPSHCYLNDAKDILSFDKKLMKKMCSLAYQTEVYSPNQRLRLANCNKWNSFQLWLFPGRCLVLQFSRSYHTDLKQSMSNCPVRVVQGIIIELQSQVSSVEQLYVYRVRSRGNLIPEFGHSPSHIKSCVKRNKATCQDKLTNGTFLHHYMFHHFNPGYELLTEIHDVGDLASSCSSSSLEISSELVQPFDSKYKDQMVSFSKVQNFHWNSEHTEGISTNFQYEEVLVVEHSKSLPNQSTQFNLTVQVQSHTKCFAKVSHLFLERRGQLCTHPYEKSLWNVFHISSTYFITKKSFPIHLPGNVSRRSVSVKVHDLSAPLNVSVKKMILKMQPLAIFHLNVAKVKFTAVEVSFRAALQHPENRIVFTAHRLENIASWNSALKMCFSMNETLPELLSAPDCQNMVSLLKQAGRLSPQEAIFIGHRKKVTCWLVIDDDKSISVRFVSKA